MDFIADAQASAREWLRRFGHKKADGVEEPYLHLLYLRRFIPLPRPRAVLESREARQQTRRLSADERLGYEQLKAEAAAGDRLLPRLTDQITKGWNSDFQSDWGLMHFHLGSTPGKGGFVKRSEYLAFVWVDETWFLVVALLSHKPGEEPWTDTDLMAILDRTWPEVLAPFYSGLTSAFPAFDGAERAELRKSGVTMLTEVNGRTYLPPGGGATSARTPGQAVFLYNSHRAELRDVQEGWLRAYPEKRTAKLRLLPFDGVTIETAEGALYLANNRGDSFERLESNRAQVYRYLLGLRDPFRGPGILRA